MTLPSIKNEVLEKPIRRSPQFTTSPTPLSPDTDDGCYNTVHTNSWSFVSEVANRSHPSSTTSFSSFYEPSTPLAGGPSIEPNFFAEPYDTMLTDDMTPIHQTSFKEHMACSPLMLPLIDDIKTLKSHPDQDWIFSQQTRSQNSTLLEPSLHHGMTQPLTGIACIGPPDSAHDTVDVKFEHCKVENEDTFRLPAQPLHASVLEPSTPFVLPTDNNTYFVKPWMAPVYNWDVESNQQSPATVAPRATMTTTPYSEGILSSPPQIYGYLSPTMGGSLATFSAGDAVRQVPDYGIESSNFTSIIPDFMNVSAPAASENLFRAQTTPVRVYRRSQRASRRNPKIRQQTRFLPGTSLHTTAPRQSHHCTHINSKTGVRCPSSFAKIEHLKRHKDTHSNVQQFSCVFCNRRFGRQDNKRDHYKTHLSEHKVGVNKNARTDFDTFYKLLREKEDEPEAEKSIAMLQKWRLKGLHLRSIRDTRSKL